MTALWTQWRATWAGLEKATLGKVRRQFNERRAKVLKAFDQVAGELAPPTTEDGAKALDLVNRNAGTIARILISIGTDAGNKLKVSVGSLLREAARLGGEQSMQEAAAAKGESPADARPFNMADPAVVAKLRQRESRISGIDATLKKRLAETLADGVDQGENTAQLSERIRSQFNFAADRAMGVNRAREVLTILGDRNVGGGWGNPLLAEERTTNYINSIIMNGPDPRTEPAPGREVK